MDTWKALASGAAGATALTVLHESARRVIPHAPRVDVIGMRALRRPIEAVGGTPPRGRNLYWLTLGGELLANSAFYAMIAAGNPRRPLRRGLIVGLIAGIGAVVFPPLMGLGQQPHRRAPYTQLMTIAWYTVGGMAAAATTRLFSRRPRSLRW